jgi:curved DNA-binding protein CbpA
MSFDPYKILEVPPYADQEMIEAAYRRLARLYQPGISILPDAEERIRDLNRAYDLLKDLESRLAYDREYLYLEHPVVQPRRRLARRRRRRPGGRFIAGIVLSLLGLLGAFYLWRAVSGSNSVAGFMPVPVTGLKQAAGTGRGGLRGPAGFPDCIPWDAIRKEDAGDRLCVYGRVDRVEQTEALTQVIRFGERQSTFTIRGSRYNYRDIAEGVCIAAVGEVQSDAGSTGGFFMDTSSTSIYRSTDCQ